MSTHIIRLRFNGDYYPLQHSELCKTLDAWSGLYITEEDLREKMAKMTITEQVQFIETLESINTLMSDIEHMLVPNTGE